MPDPIASRKSDIERLADAIIADNPELAKKLVPFLKENAETLCAIAWPFMKNPFIEKIRENARDILNDGLGITPELHKRWEALCRDMGESPDTVMTKALNLLRIANEVVHDGQRLVAIDEDDNIIREIGGIVEPISAPAGAR